MQEQLTELFERLSNLEETLGSLKWDYDALSTVAETLNRLVEGEAE